MNKTKKCALTVLACIFIGALVCAIGYCTLFANADTLKVASRYRLLLADKEYVIDEKDARIEDDGLLYVKGGEYASELAGRGFMFETIRYLPDAKATVLTAHFGDGSRYVKLADVSSPSGFAARKDAEDRDGDSLTTQFDLYYKKGSSDNQVLLSVYAYMGDAAKVAADGFEPATFTYPQDGSNKPAAKAKVSYTGWMKQLPGQTYVLLASPYENAFICAEFTHPEDYDEAQLQLLIFETVSKIAPGKQLHGLVYQFKLNFLDDSRWQYLLKGLGTTLLITLASGCMGTVLGALVAVIRSTWEKNHENMRPGFGKTCLKAVDKLCGMYLTVIRGTPVMVQLLIMYLIIFAQASNGTVSAILAFGINSGAYVAEIVRGGIMSIDNGQFEAGASLGFNYPQTMIHIIMPQAFKNILPSLANEFIALLKETSVSGYVAVKDLNKGGDIIRGVTYSPFMPLIAVALIYLAVVMFFTKLVSLLERRLRSSEHRT